MVDLRIIDLIKISWSSPFQTRLVFSGELEISEMLPNSLASSQITLGMSSWPQEGGPLNDIEWHPRTIQLLRFKGTSVLHQVVLCSGLSMLAFTAVRKASIHVSFRLAYPQPFTAANSAMQQHRPNQEASCHPSQLSPGCCTQLPKPTPTGMIPCLHI